MIEVEVWSDFVCPYCYIGKTEFDNALEKSPYRDVISVKYKAFQLNENAPTEAGETVVEELTRKYGRPESEIKKIIDGVIERGESLGLTYNYDGIMSQNTFDAHRVAKYAEFVGKSKTFHDRLYYGVFTENVFLPDVEQLVKLSTEAGLEESKVREILNDKEMYAEEVKNDQKEAFDIGAKGVPFFFFNRKYAAPGGQPEKVFEEAFKKIADEEGIKPTS